jgi:CBS domain-containing protein
VTTTAEPLATVAARLVDAQAPLEVVRGLADHLDAVTRDALADAERRLGPPPGPYAWLALGSHGRREPGLGSDQDHALVLADAAHEDYGLALARHVEQVLTQAGLRPCEGGYMASRWCHPLTGWQTLLHDRIAEPAPQAVLDTDVFLDLRPVAGTLDATGLADVMLRAAGNGRLLHGLAAAAVAFPTAVGPFGRLRQQDGRVDLKRHGLAPLVLVARVVALEASSRATGTAERLADAGAAGVLSPRAVGRLQFALALLTRLRLRHQLRCAAAGAPIGDAIPVEALTWNDERLLRRALEAIRDSQHALALQYRTDLR